MPRLQRRLPSPRGGRYRSSPGRLKEHRTRRRRCSNLVAAWLDKAREGHVGDVVPRHLAFATGTHGAVADDDEAHILPFPTQCSESLEECRNALAPIQASNVEDGREVLPLKLNVWRHVRTEACRVDTVRDDPIVPREVALAKSRAARSLQRTRGAVESKEGESGVRNDSRAPVTGRVKSTDVGTPVRSKHEHRKCWK